MSNSEEELQQESILNNLQSNLFKDGALNKSFRALENDVEESRYLAMISDYMHLMSKIGNKKTKMSPVSFYKYVESLGTADSDVMVRKLITILSCSAIMATASDAPPSLVYIYLVSMDQLGSTLQDLGQAFYDSPNLSNSERDKLFKQLNVVMDQVLYCIVALFSHESREVPPDKGISRNLQVKMQELGIQRPEPKEQSLFKYWIREAAKGEETVGPVKTSKAYRQRIEDQFKARVFSKGGDYEMEDPIELLVQTVARKRRKDMINDPEFRFDEETETLEQTMGRVLQDFSGLDEWFQVAIHSFDLDERSNPINAVYWLWIVSTTFSAIEPMELPLYKYIVNNQDSKTYKYALRGVSARLAYNAVRDPRLDPTAFKANTLAEYVRDAYNLVTSTLLNAITPIWWQQVAFTSFLVLLGTRNPRTTAIVTVTSLFTNWNITNYETFGFEPVLTNIQGLGGIVDSQIKLFTAAKFTYTAAKVGLPFVPIVGPAISAGMSLVPLIPVVGPYITFDVLWSAGFTVFSGAALVQQSWDYVVKNETITVFQHYNKTFENAKFAFQTVAPGVYDRFAAGVGVLLRWFGDKVVIPVVEWAVSTWLAKILFLLVVLYGLYRIGTSERVRDMLGISRRREDVENLAENAEQLIQYDGKQMIGVLEAGVQTLMKRIEEEEAAIVALRQELQSLQEARGQKINL